MAIGEFDPDRDIPSVAVDRNALAFADDQIKQVPPLMTALTRVEREVMQLEKITGILADRLQPVRRVEPRDERAKPGESRGHRSTIVAVVDERADQLAAITARLQVLLEELEV